MGSYYTPGRSTTRYVGSTFLPSGKETYYLMHRDIRVAKFTMTKNGMAINVIEIYEHTHMPVGTRGFQQPLLNQRFTTWKNNRSVPTERPQYDKITQATGFTMRELETINMGVSLNDCYWFQPIDKDFQWKDVNFYDNAYACDVGNIIIHDVIASDINLKTPDTATNGALPKTWAIINDRNMLLKVGTTKENQEVCNEVFASLIAERLGLDTAAYFLSKLQDGRNCSLCENFIEDNNTEFVSMQQISVERGTIGKSGVLAFLQSNDLMEDVNKMLVLDFLIANQDRHFGNFGFLRDATTLQITQMAPIFDYDKCMNIGFWGTTAGNDIAKPFAYTHAEQIQMISDIEWINLIDIKQNFNNDIAEIYGAGGFNSHQITQLQQFFSGRIQQLERVIESVRRNNIESQANATFDNKEIPKQLQEERVDAVDVFEMMEWEQS